MITILAIGKQHESWITPGLERYEKRLNQPWNIQWVLLPHSRLKDALARQEESERLTARLNHRDYVVLLDETGKMFDSPTLSHLFEQQFVHGRSLTCIIGGAYGVDDELRQRADTIWSLSSLVFPHQLVRLLLVEQLYRAQTIAAGLPYHHV